MDEADVMGGGGGGGGGGERRRGGEEPGGRSVCSQEGSAAAAAAAAAGQWTISVLAPNGHLVVSDTLEHTVWLTAGVLALETLLFCW